MELHLKDPEMSRYWKAKLIWMMDNEPARTEQMFKTPKMLMTFLDEAAAQAEASEMRQRKAGTPEDAAREIVMSMVAPTPEAEPESPLPDAKRRMILTWADRLPDRTHVTTV